MSAKHEYYIITLHEFQYFPNVFPSDIEIG